MSNDSISKLAAAIQKYQEADQDEAAKKAHSEEIAMTLLNDVDSSLTSIAEKHAATIRNCARSLSASRTSMLNEIAEQDTAIQKRLLLKPKLLSEIVRLSETDPTKAAHHYWMTAAAPTVFGRIGVVITVLMGMTLLIMLALLWTAWTTQGQIQTAKTDLQGVQEKILVERETLASFSNQTNGVTITHEDGRMLLTLPPDPRLKRASVSVLNPLLNTEQNNQYWID